MDEKHLTNEQKAFLESQGCNLNSNVAVEWASIMSLDPSKGEWSPGSPQDIVKMMSDLINKQTKPGYHMAGSLLEICQTLNIHIDSLLNRLGITAPKSAKKITQLTSLIRPKHWNRLEKIAKNLGYTIVPVTDLKAYKWLSSFERRGNKTRWKIKRVSLDEKS